MLYTNLNTAIENKETINHVFLDEILPDADHLFFETISAKEKKLGSWWSGDKPHTIAH